MLRGASTLLMVVAVVAVVGFMYWLDRKTDSLGTEVAPVLQEQGAESEGVELEAVALAADPAAAVGQTGWLRGVSVDQRLGRGAFAVRLDEASTFPVLLSADLIQLDTQVYGEDVVTLHGHVFTLNDSIRAEWVTQTAVDQEHASAIPASPSFMFADSLSFN
jgi:hypothetical protein